MRLTAYLFCASLAFAQPFKLEKTIPLPSVEGRIGHQGMDVKTQRKVATAAARTALFVPDLNRIFPAAHRGNQGAEARVFAVE